MSDEYYIVASSYLQTPTSSLKHNKEKLYNFKPFGETTK